MNYDIRLSGNGQQFELQLQNGVQSLVESSASASTIASRGMLSRYGLYDPHFSTIEKRTFHGGRGCEFHTLDPTRYFDSHFAWTLMSGKVFPAPVWRFASGIRASDTYISDSKKYFALVGDKRYLSVSFQASASYNASQAGLWIRKAGAPGTLTVLHTADASGVPGSINKTVSVTAADIGTLGEWYYFEFVGAQAQTAGTTYHIVAVGASSDNAENHWEVAVDPYNGGSKSSTNGMSWNNENVRMLFRVTDANAARTFLFQKMEGASYCVSVNDNGSNSSVYINGDRGTATGGSTTTIVDTSKSWGVNVWQGCYARAIGGAGAGQYAVITSNTSNTLTLSPVQSAAFASGTRYIIYNTPRWTELTSTGLGAVKDFKVVDKIGYFAQGPLVNMRRFRNSGGTHEWASDGSNKADVLFVRYDPSAKAPQLWRAQNDIVKISAGNSGEWVNTNFGAAISVGSTDWLITSFAEADAMYIFKEDSVWRYVNGRVDKVGVGLDGLPGAQTGRATAVYNGILYFSWWKSIERMRGAVVEDVGYWRDAGFPPERMGVPSKMLCALNYLFVAVEGNTYSSVLIWRDGAYHEIFRGWRNAKIRNIFLDSNEGVNPRLWIEIGGDLVYVDISVDPLNDSAVRFSHECAVTLSTIDLEHIDTYKYWKDIVISAKNLSVGSREIHIDYQYGDSIDTDNWTYAGKVTGKRNDTVVLNVGNEKALRVRLRMYTDNASIPPTLEAVALRAAEIVPTVRVWSMVVRVVTSGRTNDDLYRWLWEMSQSASGVYMEASGALRDIIGGTWVKLEPPSTQFETAMKRASAWGAYIQLVLREWR